MPAIQAWLQSVLATKDFIHLMFSSMLFTSQLHLKSKMHFFSCKFVTLISSFCCFLDMLPLNNFIFVTVAALPVLCWALDHVARFLRHNFVRSSFYR